VNLNSQRNASLTFKMSDTLT